MNKNNFLGIVIGVLFLCIFALFIWCSSLQSDIDSFNHLSTESVHESNVNVGTGYSYTAR